MSFFTILTRAWLTKSLKPFKFKNECDQYLPFFDCENLGLYVHIPFCKSICNFCPYCKTLYSKEQCEKYLDALIKEIHLVGSQNPEKKKVTSLYFGGGTPALITNRIKDIIDAIGEHFIITEGIGLELHPDNVNKETLQELKNAGITKISIGIQSFNDKHQAILKRKQIDTLAISSALATVPFETVSMDFIFALPEQTFDDLKSDINTAFSLGANHIAIYPFIDFSFTKSSVKPMPKKEKRKLLDKITQYCLNKGYTRNSIWTFSREPKAEYSSMIRENFLGFGCSATTLLKKQFKINTFDVEAYCNKINAKQLASSLTLRFTKRQRMIYWLFWTAYTTKVKASDFEKFFKTSLKKEFKFELWWAKRLGFIKENNDTYEMTLKGAFYFHHYESFYTLSYIDKMWGIMRKNPFPKQIKL
ncbi:MAG: radical SAM protein [Clostridia bacterium]|nr:radical SAM protein [Clostridia bacterium]